MAVASIYGFRQNPEAFYNWIRPLAQLITTALPNPAHITLAALEHLGHLQAVITQNIDMLHSRAGSRTVYELHGHLRDATCTQCFTVYAALPIVNKFLDDGLVPRCPQCHGLIKPNVILFGEQLPAVVFQAAQQVTRKADLMLIVGSSLETAPASEFPALAVRHGAKLIIINLEPTPADTLAEVVIHGNAAEMLPDIFKHMEAVV
jgi:NAD-dependent deacetylase